MTDDPIDLSPLDPLGDPLALDARVAAIARGALIPPPPDLLADIASWARPTLAAAAIVAAIATYPLVHRRPQPARSGVTTAEVLGVPHAVVELARSDTPPELVDLAEALDAERTNAR